MLNIWIYEYNLGLQKYDKCLFIKSEIHNKYETKFLKITLILMFWTNFMLF